jgi:hypothetical protein
MTGTVTFVITGREKLVAAVVVVVVFNVEVTVDKEDTTMVGAVVGNVEHTEIEVGKVASLDRGRGRVGPDAFPTGLPSPGNL